METVDLHEELSTPVVNAPNNDPQLLTSVSGSASVPLSINTPISKAQLDYYDNPENRVNSTPTMILQRSLQDLPDIEAFEASKMQSLEKLWSKTKNKASNEDEETTYAQFEIFKNLQNPTHDTMAEYMTKFRLMTKKTHRFNKYTLGTFCCRNKRREYTNSLHIIEIILDILISPLCLILFVIALIFWIIAVIVIWCFINIPCFSCIIGNSRINETTLKRIDKCVLTKESNLKDSFDFLIHRAPTYFVTLILNIPFYYIHYITGGFKYVPLISDDLMYFMVTMGPIAREINVDYPNSIEIDLHPSTSLPQPYATEITLFPGYAVVVKGCGWDIKKQETYITVVDENGEDLNVYNPNCNCNYNHEKDYIDDNYNGTSERLWKLALAHLQCTITWYEVTWSHNWVHFHLLDIAAKCRNEIVPPESVLGHLLNAHLRFTSPINLAGMDNGFKNPNGNSSNIFDRYTPWKIQPLSTQQFAFKVSQNCANYYLDIDSTTGRVNKVRYGLTGFDKTFFLYWNKRFRLTDATQRMHHSKFQNTKKNVD